MIGPKNNEVNMLFEGVVFIADGKPDKHNESVLINNIKIPNGKVLVNKDFDYDKPLGFAELEKIGDSVRAKIRLSSKLDPKDMDFLLKNSTPCVCTISSVKSDDYQIDHIALCNANSDDRILPLCEWDKHE